MTLMLSEVFELVDKQNSLEDKKNILLKSKSPALLTILRYGLDQRIQFDTEIPLYKPDTSPVGLSYGSLQREYRRLYIFTQNYTNVGINRKKNILAQILESVSPSEAKLLENVLTKTFKLNDVTNEFLNSIFPELNLPASVKENHGKEEVVQAAVEESTENETSKVQNNKKKSKKMV